MAERLKAPVLKTGVQRCTVGSNPTLSARGSASGDWTYPCCAESSTFSLRHCYGDAQDYDSGNKVLMRKFEPLFTDL